MSKDCTIQNVFHRFYPSFESTHSISPAQRKAAYHIMNCKTGAFGVNVSVCEDCGCMSVHYNSCRDRCCPMCQEFPKEKWVDARREDILDAPYFHVVFTVPEDSIPLSTATRNSYILLFIMRLQILSVNLLLIVNILGLISAIFVSSIHGEAP